MIFKSKRLELLEMQMKDIQYELYQIWKLQHPPQFKVGDKVTVYMGHDYSIEGIVVDFEYEERQKYYTIYDSKRKITYKGISEQAVR
jgi:hypothetical protein